MNNDGAADLPRHATAVVNEALNGRYPAQRAYQALAIACRHHGHANPDAPRVLLADALGRVLTQKAA